MNVKAFLSSTYEDLKDHRAHVINALRKSGVNVDPMEEWSSDPQAPKTFSRERIEGCDLVVLLVAFRRGYIPPGETRSITQLEYDYARAHGIDVLPFMLDEDAPWSRKFDEIESDPEMKNWRKEVGENQGVGTFELDSDSIDVKDALLRWQARRLSQGAQAQTAKNVDARNAYAPPTWTLDDLRESVRRSSDDYIDRMQQERVYLPQLYARRIELEDHISGFLNARCTKTGMLVVGTSGIGKTNTLCHIVKEWRDDADKLAPDAVLLLGGSTIPGLPGGNFTIRDVLMDRLSLPGDFSSFLTEFQSQGKRTNAQFVVVVDGIDKHPQPRELLNQLDRLIAECENVPCLKIIISIGENAYAAMRKAEFIPALRAYYTVPIQEGAIEIESNEILLGRMTEKELAEAYEKYRHEPGLSPTSDFDSLTDDVKNTICNPLFLKIVMEVFNDRTIRRRVLTAEVMREYYQKKVRCENNRTFFINRTVEQLFENRVSTISFDALSRVDELRTHLMDTSPQSPYSQLLDEQVLAEVHKRVEPFLPEQRFVGFTYDRLLEYSLLIWIGDTVGFSPDTVAQLSNEASDYLPLRGAIGTLLHSKVESRDFSGAAELLHAGNREVMTAVAVDLLMELEQMSTATENSDVEQDNNSVSELLNALESKNREWVEAVLLECGERLQKMGLFRRAHLVYERALRIAEVTEDKVCEGTILEALGKVHFVLGEMTKAESYFERSLAIGSELLRQQPTIATRSAKASTLLNLSEVHHRMGQIPKALELVEEATAIYEDIEDNSGLAEAFHKRGVLERRKGRAGEARKHHNQALRLHQALDEKKGQAQDRCGIGLAFLVDGQWKSAYPELNTALTMYEEVGDKTGIAYTCNALGETYRWEGEDLERAAQNYKRALELYEEMEAERDIHMVLNNLGATCLFSGDENAALQYLQRAKSIQTKVAGIEGEPETLAFLSGALLASGDLNGALETSDTALAILERLRFGEEDVQLVYWYRYQILDAMARHDESKQALKQAFDNVMQQVDTVEDPKQRDGFIENFRLRREIVEAWNRVSP